MTLRRRIGTGFLLATAALLAYAGVGFASVWVYYDPPNNAALGAGKALVVALAPMLLAVGLVFGAVSLSKRNRVVAGVGIAIVGLGFVGAAVSGASMVMDRM